MSDTHTRATARGIVPSAMIDEATRAARAAEREARRKANQERWANDPANANHTRLQRQAAVTPAIEAEAKGDSNGSNSLQRMRDIMSDAGAPLYRRLDAAECVLTFELGPGAAAGADPDTIAATSYRFLRAAADAPETPEALKFRALKSIITVENTRAQVKNTTVEYMAKRELLVNLVNSERQRLYRQAGCWRRVVESGSDWALSLNDDFDWLPGWPGTWQWPASEFAAPLEQASRERNEAFRAQLRAVRAKNRVDDWERLLGENAA